MSVEKVLEDYQDVTTECTNRTCHKCKETIKSGAPFLFMRRNRHIYNVCGACLLFFAKKVEILDPSLTPKKSPAEFNTKADMTEKLVEAGARE